MIFFAHLSEICVAPEEKAKEIDAIKSPDKGLSGYDVIAKGLYVVPFHVAAKTRSFLSEESVVCLASLPFPCPV
jgi:hypothetical protein